MSLFSEALALARETVTATFAGPMTLTAMIVSEYKGGAPDPSRAPLTIPGVLHEHSTRRGGEEGITERTDGGRPGRSFGIDMATAPTRISFDLADLGGWVPPQGTRIAEDASGRCFEVTHPAPPNGGRVFLYVTELSP